MEETLTRSHGALTTPLPILPRAEYPFDKAFYHELVSRRGQFQTLAAEDLETTGHGFTVEAGQAFRLTLLGGPQIIDICFVNANEPTEHFFTGAQMAIEGGRVSRFTRLWGTPPESRPLATCIADSLRVTPNPRRTRDHFSYGAHCNAHLWHLYTGIHHRPCYDNMRYGFAMLGLHQRYIHDNVNLFQKGGYDPFTGAHLIDASDAGVGDFIEFYAEIDLMISISLCPNSAGSEELRGSWSETGPSDPVHPVRVETFETRVAPLAWPYESER
jgi:uncharacterized protein YcgI (DUF1989 family)